MFLNDDDKRLVRMGSTIVFLEQLVEAQKKEIEELEVKLGTKLQAKETEASTASKSCG